MKFKGSGILWDAENNRALVNFNEGKGIVETTDERTISILKKNGFIEDSSIPVTPETIETNRQGNEVEEEGTVTPTNKWAELKRKASSLGIMVRGKTKTELEQLIAEKKNV